MMVSHLDQQMQAFNEARVADLAAGQAAMTGEIRSVIDGLKVGEDLTLQLGCIERANDLATLDLANGKADGFLSSVLAYGDIKSIDDWELLGRHINNRANARRIQIQAFSLEENRMEKFTSVPEIDGLFWYFENGVIEPRAVSINQVKWGNKFKSFNGAEQSWLRDGEYLVGPQASPAAPC